MPLVSVVIPTYKHAGLILETLRSVFAQTFSDYEVIVVNDGSPDDTADRLRPLALNGKIRYLEQQNTGQAKARNRGLVEVKGEYVAFLDDDDLWPPDKLEWQVETIRKHNADAVGGLAEVLASDDDEHCFTVQSGCSMARLHLRDMFKNCPFVSPGQVLIKTATLREIGGFDENVWGADDFDLWIRLSAVGTILKVSRGALLYRIHENNASRSADRMFENVLLVVTKSLKYIDLEHRSRAQRDGFRFVYFLYGSRVIRGWYAAGWMRLPVLSVLKKMLVPSLRDPMLAKRVAIDISAALLDGAKRSLKRAFTSDVL